MKDKYDVIIIGAGIGGLVTACNLAKNGLSVLVVEKNKYPGGCVSNIKHGDYLFDFGATFITGCSRWGLMSRFFSMGLSGYFCMICGMVVLSSVFSSL